MATTLQLGKDELVAKAKRNMQQLLPDNTWSPRQKLALTCRILFDAGHDSGLAGQITARAEAPGTYYTQRLGLGFDEISERNLLLVDEDLNVLEGDGMANPANRLLQHHPHRRAKVVAVGEDMIRLRMSLLDAVLARHPAVQG